MKIKVVKTNNGYQIHVGDKVHFFKFSNVLEDIYKIYVRFENESKVVKKIPASRLKTKNNKEV